MKRQKIPDETAFTKGGEPLAVRRFHRQFASVQFLLGFTNVALIFNAAYLKNAGLSATQVGAFISMSSLVGMFAPMFWGMMSDRFRTVKKIIYICVCSMLVVYLPIPLYHKIALGTLTLAPVFIVVQTMFSSAPETMMTAWIIQTQRKYPDIQYGFIRMFFTGAYALGNILYMFLIQRTSYDVVFLGYTVFGAATIFMLTRYDDVEPPEGARKSFKEMQVGRVFKNKMLIVYIIFMLFACIPSSSLGLFTPYLIEDIGGSSSFLGGMIATRSLFALPALYFSNRFLRRLGPRRTLLIAALLFALSQLFFVFCRTMTQAFVNCALMGIALGVMMPSEASFANEQAPEGLVSTTQTVCGTVYSIAGILCNFFGGMVVDALGIRVYYAAVSVLVLLSAVFFFFATRIVAAKKEASG